MEYDSTKYLVQVSKREVCVTNYDIDLIRLKDGISFGF